MRRCPEHAEPQGDALDAWPCPDDCPDFLAELERRIDDIKLNGNFIRVTTIDGVQSRQEFRNHHPVGEPTVRMVRSQEEA